MSEAHFETKLFRDLMEDYGTEESVRQILYVQYVHDELFHQDIFNMPKVNRYIHHLMHFRKYVSELRDGAFSNWDRVKHRVVDTISTCHSLFAAGQYLPILTENDVALYLDTARNFPKYLDWYDRTINTLVAHMEHVQHGDDFNHEKFYTRNLEPLWKLTLLSSINNFIDPVQDYFSRLESIQQRSIFFDYLNRRWKNILRVGFADQKLNCETDWSSNSGETNSGPDLIHS